MGDGEDLAMLVVPSAGELIATGDPYEPFRLSRPDGAAVEPVTEFFRDLLAWPAGRKPRSVLMGWICCAGSGSSGRPGSGGPALTSGWPGTSAGGCRCPHGPAGAMRQRCGRIARRCCAAFTPITWRPGTGPLLNPFPLDRARRRGRAGAHHNPMDPHQDQRSGRYRPKLVSRVPRAVSDEEFNAIFARLPSNRDRALVAFYVSTGAAGL